MYTDGIEIRIPVFRYLQIVFDYSVFLIVLAVIFNHSVFQNNLIIIKNNN